MEQFLSLVKQYHRGQRRNSNQEQWEHCDAVARELKDALSLEKNLPAAKKREMILGALGHDLYEDSAILPEKVIATYGGNVHDRIMGVTNTEGDDHPEKYVAHLEKAPEEDRLIKLADFIDNYGSVARSLPELGREWATGWFLPLVEPMYARVTHTTFSRFPRAAEILLRHAADARQELLSLVAQAYDSPRSPFSMSLGSPTAEPASPETRKEPWDFDEFKRLYNECAKRVRGWDFEEKPGIEERLHTNYDLSDAKTLAEYAEFRLLYEQRS